MPHRHRERLAPRNLVAAEVDVVRNVREPSVKPPPPRIIRRFPAVNP
jgi:hypothetical protein